MIKTIAVAAVTALVVSLVFVGLVGNQTSENLGAVGTRFPNGINITNRTATSSLILGKVCMTITSATGTVFYASYNGAGALATSTTSCL